MTDWPKKLSEDALTALALDIFRDQVFTSAHIPAEEASHRILGMIFLPIGLGGLSDRPKEELENIGIAYEYLSQAGPRAVNGYPTFMSVQFLDREQALQTLALVTKLSTAAADVLKGEERPIERACPPGTDGEGRAAQQADAAEGVFLGGDVQGAEHHASGAAADPVQPHGGLPEGAEPAPPVIRHGN